MFERWQWQPHLKESNCGTEHECENATTENAVREHMRLFWSLFERQKMMTGIKIPRFCTPKLCHSRLLSQDSRKTKTIDAQAMGASTQMGQTVGIKVTI